MNSRSWIPCLPALLLFAGSLSAELPPLIPRAELYANPARTAPKISPDGRYMGYLSSSAEGVMNVWAEDLETGEQRMLTSDTSRGIWEYDWAYDGEHILYIQDRQGDENWHLFATDIESGESRDLTPHEGITTQNLTLSKKRPHELLIEMNLRDSSAFDMMRIDIRSGETTLEAESPGDISDWAADDQLRVRGATALDVDTSDTILRVKRDGEWVDLIHWSFLDTGSVLYKKILGFDDHNRMLIQSPIGTSMTHLAWVDMDSGEEVEIVAVSNESDVGNLWWNPVFEKDPDDGHVQAVMFDYLVPEWRVLDDSIRADFEALGKVSEGFFFIESRNADDRRWIVSFISDVFPFRYYLYDRDSGEAKFLFEELPASRDMVLAHKKPVTIIARDGRKLPSYLTLPVGVEAKKLPLVLNPHGGPWARDYWFFDPGVQHLANRGYAVLQVNFRGSTGYGPDHVNAGNEQWGVGSMQHDLTDAVKWAIDEGIADPARVAISGGSYGGYATLAGITFTPELYACAVGAVGPSNVATAINSFPPYWQVRKVRWLRRVGPVTTDEEFNRRISPLFHTDAIRAPLLLGHGAHDPRVVLPESEQIVAAMREHDREVEFIVYPDEGHGWFRPENILDWAGRMEQFLGTHLDVRYEPWVAVEGSSAEVR